MLSAEGNKLHPGEMTQAAAQAFTTAGISAGLLILAYALKRFEVIKLGRGEAARL
jgi:hypothetical protein